MNLLELPLQAFTCKTTSKLPGLRVMIPEILGLQVQLPCNQHNSRNIRFPISELEHIKTIVSKKMTDSLLDYILIQQVNRQCSCSSSSVGLKGRLNYRINGCITDWLLATISWVSPCQQRPLQQNQIFNLWTGHAVGKVVSVLRT